MSKGPIRRAQLVTPFGVGSMVVVRDGTSLITAGLDHWYKRENGQDDVDETEFRIEEWRLAIKLGVDHFRLPPDFRTTYHRGDSVANAYLTVPFLRFPQWHYCPSCGYLKQLKLTQRIKEKCPQCQTKNRLKYMVQVPIITICEHGHIQDFPWREWVHKSSNPTCNKQMRLVGTGSATLAGLTVECGCGQRRSLGRVTEASQDSHSKSTFLSKNLDDSDPEFLCQGKRPWLGTEESESCSQPLKGSLRSASNVYYSQVRSAIYLQRGNDPELMAVLEEPPLSTLISLLSQVKAEIKPEALRGQHPQLLQPYTNQDIQSALDVILSGNDENTEDDQLEGERDYLETSFRRPEFNVLRTDRNEKYLKVRSTNLHNYNPDIGNYFSRIMLVDKLRETRALFGFSRIFPEAKQSLDTLKSALRRHPIEPSQSWLPAYVVYGEGVFIEFNEKRIQQWLKQQGNQIKQRINPLLERYQKVQEQRDLRNRHLTPRFILLHTFAHLLMNRLTFECGYSSAALRERLYISDHPDAPMAGILIYTAAGDAEGTMGGLVRMGKPGNFEPMFYAALEAASWCSADPVCMEIGGSGGQGPDSCNLAACHNCALVPETACEEFNRFLDRGLVVGEITNHELGFFTCSDLQTSVG
jgi:hypothetical protein